ncbi:TPA: DUF550 domain-containing protein [Raoultella ornithinolytica]|nr:DUF550 domain-containing protein [Raoultella ornithinolytica]
MTSKLTIEQTQQIIDAADAVITALAGTNDEVHKDDTDKMVRLWDDLNDRYAPPEVVRELARMALAAMDSEPVAYTDERNLGYIDRGAETGFMWGNRNLEPGDIALYRHAQSAPERDQVRREHAEWSQATFGDVGPVGPLKHLSKEALEAAAEPGDLSEWADMQFLLWDAQRRAGITDEQITQALIEKLAVNKQREWPEPKDGEPRLHIKEQPAPVVPEKATVGEMPFLGASEGVYVRGWNDCRAAMLQAGSDEIGSWGNGKHPPSDKPAPIDHGYRQDCECSGCKAMGRICDELAGWIPVSERLPELDTRVLLYFSDYDGHIEDGCIGDDGDGPYHYFFDGDSLRHEPTHWMPMPAAPQEVQEQQKNAGGEGE